MVSDGILGSAAASPRSPIISSSLMPQLTLGAAVLHTCIPTLAACIRVFGSCIYAFPLPYSFSSVTNATIAVLVLHPWEVQRCNKIPVRFSNRGKANVRFNSGRRQQLQSSKNNGAAVFSLPFVHLFVLFRGGMQRCIRLFFVFSKIGRSVSVYDAAAAVNFNTRLLRRSPAPFSGGSSPVTAPLIRKRLIANNGIFFPVQA